MYATVQDAPLQADEVNAEENQGKDKSQLQTDHAKKHNEMPPRPDFENQLLPAILLILIVGAKITYDMHDLGPILISVVVAIFLFRSSRRQRRNRYNWERMMSSYSS